MSNYEKYSYSRTLQELDDYYNHDTEPVNYAEVMISMGKCNTIDQCIQVWKRVYTKYVSLTGVTEVTGHEAFVDDLNSCLNENLLRFASIAYPKTNMAFALECLANMRQCSNLESYQKEWFERLSYQAIPVVAGDIIDAQKEYEKYRSEFLSTHYKQGTNGYKKIKDNINKNIEVLKSYGYRMLPYDVKFDNSLVDKLLAGLILFAVAVIVVLLLIWIWTGKFSEIFTGVIVFLEILGVVLWFVKLLLGKK